MFKKELAEQLGISGAMVSKLAKRGMPTDTLERAQRWRRRHLEPGRVKGQRMGKAAPPPARQASRANPVTVPVEKVEALGMEANEFMAAFPGEPQSDDLIDQLRTVLREVWPIANPRFTLRVWLRLVDYCLPDDSVVRRHSDIGVVLDHVAFEELHRPGITTGEWLSIACDFGGYAVNGWPPDWDELED